jgi:hypothetical protein
LIGIISSLWIRAQEAAKNRWWSLSTLLRAYLQYIHSPLRVISLFETEQPLLPGPEIIFRPVHEKNSANSGKSSADFHIIRKTAFSPRVNKIVIKCCHCLWVLVITGKQGISFKKFLRFLYCKIRQNSATNSSGQLFFRWARMRFLAGISATWQHCLWAPAIFLRDVPLFRHVIVYVSWRFTFGDISALWQSMLRDATLGEAMFSTLCSCPLCSCRVQTLQRGESRNTNIVDIASYIICVRYAPIILKITTTSIQ